MLDLEESKWNWCSVWMRNRTGVTGWEGVVESTAKSTDVHGGRDAAVLSTRHQWVWNQIIHSYMHLVQCSTSQTEHLYGLSSTYGRCGNGCLRQSACVHSDSVMSWLPVNIRKKDLLKPRCGLKTQSPTHLVTVWSILHWKKFKTWTRWPWNCKIGAVKNCGDCCWWAPGHCMWGSNKPRILPVHAVVEEKQFETVWHPLVQKFSGAQINANSSNCFPTIHSNSEGNSDKLVNWLCLVQRFKYRLAGAAPLKLDK